MASGNFFTGRDASVQLDGTEYPYADYKISVDKTRIDFTNFKSAGAWREKKTGFKDGTISLNGPLDVDLALPILNDDPVTVITTITAGVYISWPCVCAKGGINNSVEDGARLADEFVITGEPTFFGLS
jgi:hypothetical protein